MSLGRCPACAGSDLRPIYHLPAIPTQSVVLVESAEAALAYPRGELTLTLCRGCGFLFNASFDAARVDYSQTTEESQHFSGTFNRFAKALAAETAAERPLAGKLTLEIGCGKGDFLEELVRQSGTRALGIDPGYLPDRDDPALARTAGDVRFLREYFAPHLVDEPPNLIVCRHTLEHIADVRGFMADVSAVARAPDAQILFETPDVRRVLEEGAFWDIYYEHCSYFTIGSHARLFRRAGLDVRRSYLGFAGQYIVQYAEPGHGAPRPEEDDLAAILGAADRFADRVAACAAAWRARIAEAHRAGRRVALWGGGSKAVAFLTSLGLDAEIAQVVDINAFKQGKYLPGTSRRVVAPEDLKNDPPGLVIVMNPIYREEIGASLAALGLSPELVAL